MLLLTIALLFGANLISQVSSVCTAEGFRCQSTCKQLARCTATGNNTFAEQVVRTCAGTAGKFCNVATLDCTGDICQDDGLNIAKLTCHENGKFPHPTNCWRYYTCINGSLTESICIPPTSYNPINGNCSSDSTTRACTESPIPKCSGVQDSGAYIEDPSVFYICAYDTNGYLRPELHRCDVGYRYDDEEKTCVMISSATQMSVVLPIFSIFFALINLVS